MFADMHMAGLSHISAVFGMYAAMAATINASLYLPKPCKLLASQHNGNKKVECDHDWSLYLRLPKYATEKAVPLSDKITSSVAETLPTEELSVECSGRNGN